MMKVRLQALLGLLLLPIPAALAMPSAAEIGATFNAIDRSGNGAISHAEWERASLLLFRSADKDRDNFLVPADLGVTTIAQDTFSLADRDHDGRLSMPEYMRLRRALFTAADVDHNENLTRVEFELLTLLSETGWSDQGHNGRLEPSELRAALIQGFARIDEDHDNFLCPAELAYMKPARRERFDEDHDGRVSQDEFVQGYLNFVVVARL